MAKRALPAIVIHLWVIGCGGARLGGHSDSETGLGGPSASLTGHVILLGAESNFGAVVTVLPAVGQPVSENTDSAGNYLIEALPAGDFQVTFEAAGYQGRTLQGTLAAGASSELSTTLERSSLLSRLTSLPDAGAVFVSSPWITSPDGGQAPGSQLFYMDTAALAMVDLDGGVKTLITSDGGLRLLGFDAEGGAVVERVAEDWSAVAVFADVGETSQISLGQGIEPGAMVMGDSVFFGVATAPGEAIWSACGRGDLAPTPVEENVSTRFPPIALRDQMAGWTVLEGGRDVPWIFGAGFSNPIAAAESERMTELQGSVDGDLIAFLALPPPPFLSVADAGEDLPPAGPKATQIFIVGTDTLQAQDSSLDSAGDRAMVYPVSETSYAGQTLNPDGTLHLFIHELDGDGCWVTSWEGDVDGWTPLHGNGLAVAAWVDGGLTLTLAGSSVAIPFAHAWSPPVFSADNRYLVFLGVPSIFDLENQVEIPLVIAPIFVDFNRAETSALLLDASGQIAVAPLGIESAPIPLGTLLEGQALAASFTPDEQGVVYLGTDALGTTGIFFQPLPAMNLESGE
jgi:Carboxypeptidase regulatory-like domain